MSGRELVQSGFVALLFPTYGQKVLFLSFQERSIHGGANELATNP